MKQTSANKLDAQTNKVTAFLMHMPLNMNLIFHIWKVYCVLICNIHYQSLCAARHVWLVLAQVECIDGMYLASKEVDQTAYCSTSLRASEKDRLICTAKGFFMNKLIYGLLTFNKCHFQPCVFGRLEQTLDNVAGESLHGQIKRFL